MAKLDPKVTPALLSTESGTALPSDVTVYLDIDLENGVKDAANNPFNMTAVYLPDPAQTGDPVNVLLWFHGHKDGSTASLRNKSPNPRNPLALKGYSAKEYLAVDEYKLREFIAKTANRKFILVVPTLSDGSGAGLLGTEVEAEGFLKQLVNGINKYTKAKVTAIGNIVLAAHSGGGEIMAKVSTFGGSFARVKEIWCDDCTYGSGPAFEAWAEKKTSKGGRLWVFSTGSSTHYKRIDKDLPEGPGNYKLRDASKPEDPSNFFEDNGQTGWSANKVLAPALSRERATANAVAKAVADAKAKAKKEGTSEADAAAAAQTDAEDKANKMATVEERIQGAGPTGQTKNWTYGGGRGHNESIEDYFSQLVRTSSTLK
jgi:hypothetical protein